ncbi:MAG: type II and III secretion system protein [Gammaproteobacteria bacterium]
MPVVANDERIEIIGLQNRPAAEVQTLLQPLLETGEGISSDGFNLIVKASPDRLETIRSLVETLDAPLHNLMISVLQNSQKSADQLNAEAAIVASPDTIRMHGMVGDTRDLQSQRSVQQLRTLEGQAAHIQVGQLRPIQNLSSYSYGYPGISVNTQMQAASTGFAVIPRLRGDNEVVVDIAPWSDRFLANAAIASQSIQTSIRTHLGEWIEIGGSGIQGQKNTQGFNGLNYTTRDHESRILIKVDKID